MKKHPGKKTLLAGILLFTLIGQQLAGNSLLSGLQNGEIFAQEVYENQKPSDTETSDTAAPVKNDEEPGFESLFDSGSTDEKENKSEVQVSSNDIPGDADLNQEIILPSGAADDIVTNTNAQEVTVQDDMKETLIIGEDGQGPVIELFESQSDQEDSEQIIAPFSSDMSADPSGTKTPSANLFTSSLLSSYAVNASDIIFEDDELMPDSILTSAVGASVSGSMGSMKVTVQWLDSEGNALAANSPCLPSSDITVVIKKITGEDYSTARDVSREEITYQSSSQNLRADSKEPWTAAWTNLHYAADENYIVALDIPSDAGFELYDEKPSWNLADGTASWDTTLVFKLKPVTKTVQLLFKDKDGNALSAYKLPTTFHVALYQTEAGSEELTIAMDADGVSVDSVELNYGNGNVSDNSRVFNAEFLNLPNTEKYTYVLQTDLPAYFREDAQSVDPNDRNILQINYTCLQEYIEVPVSIEWYMSDGVTPDPSPYSSGDIVSVSVSLKSANASSKTIYVTIDENWKDHFLRVPLYDESGQTILYDLQPYNNYTSYTYYVEPKGSSAADGFLIKYIRNSINPEPGYMNIPVTVEWYLPDGVTPDPSPAVDSVPVWLGDPNSPNQRWLQVYGSHSWNGVFWDVPILYDEYGQEISYNFNWQSLEPYYTCHVKHLGSSFSDGFLVKYVSNKKIDREQVYMNIPVKVEWYMSDGVTPDPSPSDYGQNISGVDIYLNP